MKTITKILIVSNILTLFLLISVFCFLGKYAPLEIALENMSQHIYTDEYRCLDFSKELVKKLQEIGIQSSIIIGESPETIDNDIQHVWVGIWIEPQTGEFTKDYLQNYQLSIK